MEFVYYLCFIQVLYHIADSDILQPLKSSMPTSLVLALAAQMSDSQTTPASKPALQVVPSTHTTEMRQSSTTTEIIIPLLLAEQTSETQMPMVQFSESTFPGVSETPTSFSWIDREMSWSNLSALMERNTELIETFITKLYSVCTENAQICEYKIEDESVPNSTSSCCVRCSCGSLCAQEQTCCPSKMSPVAKYENSRYFGFLSCINTYKFLEKTAADRLYLHGYKDKDGYLFVTSCPENTTSENKYLCEDLIRNDHYSVMDAVPVTDLADNTHFANGFCAACHNVRSEQAKPWNVGVSCLNEEISDIRNLESIVRNREACFFQFVPPENVPNSSLFSCQPDLIDRCNLVGKWSLYDKQVEELCLDIRLEKSHRSCLDGVEYGFKNVFCAICNGAEVGDLDCEPVTIRLIQPLHTLLSYSGADVANMGYTERICKIGQVFIPYLAACKIIHCISPYMVDILHNTCAPPASKDLPRTKHIHLPVTVALKPNIQFSRRQEIVDRVIDILDLYFAYHCILSIVYELDTVYAPHLNDSTVEDENIKALYVSIQYKEWYLHGDYLLSYVSSVNIRKNVTIQGSDVLIEIRHNTVDPVLFKLEDNDEDQMIVKQNPHNRTSLVYSMTSDNCTDNANERPEHPLHFMDCPSILVPFDELNIIRISTGISMVSVDKTIKRIDFSHFKTLNSSHVYICLDSMIDTSRQSGADGVLIGTCYVFSIFVLQSFAKALW